MINLVNPFASPMRHCEDAAASLLKNLNIKFTKSYLQKELIEHPDYPSLTAIADVIGISYDIACAPVKISQENIKKNTEITTPFLAQISIPELYHSVFAVVTKISNDSIELYNPATKKNERYTASSFDDIYKGLILLVEPGKKTQEEKYAANLREEKSRNFFILAALLIIPVLTIFSCVIYLISYPLPVALLSTAYTLLTIAGSTVAVLLLWHEIDEYSPIIKKICRATAQVNCSAVLNSKLSKVMGLSWSSLGFIYFTGILLALLIGGLTRPAFAIANWFSTLSAPYIFFSIYYQWKVVKQWCVLCLMVQALLLLQFIVALANGFYKENLFQLVSLQTWVAYITSFGFVLSLIIILIPALKKAKDNRQKTIELQRMKHNIHIFEGLLAKQRAMAKPADGLGITIGNANGVYRLIKVCNPYCGPCADAHPIMEEIAENNDEVCLQVIFTATEDEKDIAREPVLHFMEIAAQNDPILTKQALDDWYNAPVKDYNSFAEKYIDFAPISMQPKKNINTNGQKAVRAMSEWCKTVNIHGTPTFFICMNTYEKENGHPKFYQLPEMYSIADLKYFFTI